MPIPGPSVGASGTILRTTNGGTSWDTQTSGTTVPLHGVAFQNANIGTVVGNSGTILKTTDGGSHWVPQNSSTTDHLWDVSFSDANNGAAVGEGRHNRQDNRWRK
jgi:Uncharacterized protein related to plant photosystem II stability/assembly factor